MEEGKIGFAFFERNQLNTSHILEKTKAIICLAIYVFPSCKLAPMKTYTLKHSYT